MQIYKNDTGIPLSLAVWLATDDYDHNSDPYTISVTTLLKSIKQIILGTRIPENSEPVDISTLVASRMGTAIHSSIEAAWTNNYQQALRDLGYPEGLIKKIKINPDKVVDGEIPVHMEIRSDKKIGKWTISGKYDFTAEGMVEDFKSTSVFTFISGNNDKKYIQQGSIYRWLNPEIITQDVMAIQFIFTDFSAMKAKVDKNYPPSKTYQHKLNLMPLPITENFIAGKLNQIETYWDKDQAEIPECNAEELWRKETVFKYYKNPAKLSRSTKNFTNIIDANNRLANDGHVGIVKEVKGEVVACRYCNAVGICKQAEALILSDDLKL